MKKCWNCLNGWLEKKSTLLGSWSSLLQIIVFPAVLITVILGYIQLKEYFQYPDLHIKFSNPKSMNFTLVNSSKVVANRPSYGFGIFDLDAKPIDIVPIPWKETSYIKVDQGPKALMNKYGKDGHRYFGFAAIECKNGKQAKWYWLYFVHGSESNAWYVEMGDGDPKVWDPVALMKDPFSYIKDRFPEYRRISIK